MSLNEQNHHHGHDHFRHPHITQLVNEEISVLAPYAGLILVITLVIIFLFRYYVFEGFLLKKIYGKTYLNQDFLTQRGFINHHIAACCKIVMLIVAGYPLIAVLSGAKGIHAPYAKGSSITIGDILLVINQVFVAMYIFELIFRVKLSYVAVLHHVGTVVIASAAVAISLNWKHQKDATIEFILCYVWGMFDVIAEFWPHIAIILYRVYPDDHMYLSKVFFSGMVVTFSGTIVETIVVFWLWGSLWERWTLPFRIVTPILHIIFSAAQIWGSYNFYKMWKRQQRLLQQKKEQDVAA